MWVLGKGGHGVVGVVRPVLVRLHPMLARGRAKRLSMFMPACCGSRRRMAGRGLAEHERHARCEHA